MKNTIKLVSLCFLILLSIIHSCKKEEIPTLSTSTITNITATSATSGGNITSDGGATVIERGACWGVNEDPNTSDSKTNDGSGTGQFVSEITGLIAGTTYHVRAYATNSVGTAYGADLSFTTLGKAPECLTQAATNTTSSESTLNGTVNANDLSTIVTFEYGTTTSYGSTITSTQSPVTGNTNTNVSAVVTGLTAGTTYHFRVKGVNAIGTTYGSDILFTTLGGVPSCVTLAATNISTGGATLNGTVNANYSSTTVIFEYGMTTSYGSTVTALQSPVTGNNSTNVSAAISGLNAGTTYHFRVKAVNSLGTTNGNDLTFTTTSSIPTLTTTQATNVISNSATTGGNITSDGGAVITARGVCWATTPNPTIDNDITIDGISTGSFTSSMKCMTEATTYYVRAYATNSAGTAYGDQQSFTTEISPIVFNPTLTYGSVSDIDGNCYKTIQIGDQVWMAENLKTSKYNDGSSIPNITDNKEWSELCFSIQNEFGEWINSGTGAFCWYNNDFETYDNDYGKLYNWIAVTTGKLCPIGWHVPTLNEWEQLITDDYIEGVPRGGGLLETGTEHWDESLYQYSPDFVSTNETGFTALPGGIRSTEGEFSSLGLISIYWASDYYFPTSYAFRFRLPYSVNYSPATVSSPIGNGLSIRCIKD